MNFTPDTLKSREAAQVLKAILQYNPMVPYLTPKKRRMALELAISILEARAVDAEDAGDDR